MSFTRDQFISYLETTYYTQVFVSVGNFDTFLSIYTNNKTAMNAYLTNYLRAQGRINFYLAAWDAAPNQAAKDAVVASVDGVLGNATVDPETAVFWPDSGGRFGDTRGPASSTTGNIAGYGSTTGKLLTASTQAQSDWTQANSSAVDFIKNKPSIPSGQIQSDWTQTNNASVDFIKNKPASLSQSSASRTLNTIFQVNSTRWTEIRYSVDISTTVSLSGSQIGRVVLEMATNVGFTTGVQELQSFGNGNSGTLVIGLVLTQLCTACLSGKIPPGNYVRLRTVNITGTPTFTYVSGQEVLL